MEYSCERGQTSQFIGLSKQSIRDQLKQIGYFPILGFNWISNTPPLALIPCAPCGAPCFTAAMSRMNTHWKLIRAIIDELEC